MLATDGVPPSVVHARVQAIAEGHGHAMVLKTDGTVWAWGANGNGQLGDGTTSHYRHSFLKKVFSGQ